MEAGDAGRGASARFTIGTKVEATDGTAGHLVGVVVGPVAQKLTHLIVQPRPRKGLDRLVPVSMVDSAGDPITLNATVAEFLRQDEAEEIQFVPVSDGTLGYTPAEAYAWPHYELGLPGGFGRGGIGDIAYEHHVGSRTEGDERIPTGDVEIRRGDQVHASDGWIGTVKGLVVDPGDDHVTHVLLAEGHLWGRKQVAIPIAATARIGDEIKVDLTKQQIEDLPAVEVGSGPGA
jgi:PRC-barrel domain